MLPAATPQQRAQMDRAQKDVEDLLKQAEDKASQRGVFAVLGSIPNPFAKAVAYLSTGEADGQLAGVVQMNRSRFNSWSTTERGWAERGYDLNGDYSVQFWLDRGKDILGGLSKVLGSYADTSNFEGVKQTAEYTFTTVKDTAAEAADAAKKAAKKVAEPWPLSVKVGLWLVGGTAAAGALAALLGQVNALPIPRIALPSRRATS